MTRAPEFPRPVTILLLTTILSACADTHGIAPASPGPRAVSGLHMESTLAAVRATPSPWPRLDWWKPYADPGLDALMDETLKSNPSLAAADARLRKAVAASDLSGTALQPGFAVRGSAVYQRLSENFQVPPPYGGMWTWWNDARITATYELDLWGKNSAALAAAIGQAQAAEVDTFAAKLLLTTAVGQAYVQLAEAYELRDVAQATLEARQKMLDLVKSRVAAGLDTQLDLKQAEAALPMAREDIAAHDESIRLAEDQLAALAGDGPDRGLTIPRPNFQLPPLGAAPALPANLSADLLGRRPDIVASRLRVEAAAQGIISAKAAFYPDIDLTAFAGLQSFGLSKFFDPGSAVAGIGPVVTLPIFNGGTLRSALGTKAAEYDNAVATYDQTLLNALKEIADRLASLRAVAEQSAQQSEAQATLEAAYGLAVQRYKEGLGTYLQVLSVEEQVLAQHSLAAGLRARRVIYTVALVGALGGGFESPAPDKTAHVDR